MRFTNCGDQVKERKKKKVYGKSSNSHNAVTDCEKETRACEYTNISGIKIIFVSISIFDLKGYFKGTRVCV